MLRPAPKFLLIGLLVAIPGIVLVVVGHHWLLALGILLILLGSGPVGIGLGLVFSGSVARWAARHKLFA